MPRSSSPKALNRRFVALSLLGGAVVVLDSTTGTQFAAVRGDGTPIRRLTFESDGCLVIWQGRRRVEHVAVLAPS